MMISAAIDASAGRARGRRAFDHAYEQAARNRGADEEFMMSVPMRLNLPLAIGIVFAPPGTLIVFHMWAIHTLS
jgi:hypothetical protein